MPDGRGGRPQILLVDDAKEHRDLYALMLESSATVVTAARGEEALELAGRVPFDAIILDVLMPGMNGWEVCRRLKANPSTADTPVILLTSLDGVDAAGTAHRAGAAAVLMKPCPIERLVQTVDDVMGRRGRTSSDEPAVLAMRMQMRSGRRAPVILVVDPDEPTLGALDRKLTGLGYATVTASDFASGMQRVRTERPDLLIAALRLGDFNGLQYVALSERHIPSIILGEEPSDEALSRSRGAEYLRKPVDVTRLAELVERMLGANKPTARIRRWVRKTLRKPVPVRLGKHPAHLVNVSYGGFCLQIDAPPVPVPTSLEVTFPASDVTVHAEVAWRDRRSTESWRCGAALPASTDGWRTFVDALS